MNLVKDGTYSAKVESHAITETKAGDPQATVTFSFEAEGKHRKITWFGSFKDKAQPHTIKGLIACGLKGNNPGGPLQIGKEVSIVIETHADDKGREVNKVRWVNEPGGVRNVIDSKVALAKLSMLEGAVMKARQETPKKDDDDESFEKFMKATE
jgi:hypothetical protein